MADVRVEGAEQLRALSKALRAAGRKDLQRELGKAVNRATKPMVDDAKASVMSIPAKGTSGTRGTRAQIARHVRRQRRQGGVKIWVATGLDRGRRAVAASWENKGEVVHPVFGIPGTRAVTRGRRDWFRGPVSRRAPQVRAALQVAMNDVARKIERSV